jgi:hypothetical protein
VEPITEQAEARKVEAAGADLQTRRPDPRYHGGMSEAPDKRRRRRRTWVFPFLRAASKAAGAVLILLALYVLSIGPVYNVCWRGYISFKTVQPIYRPLRWVYVRDKRAKGMIDWYLWMHFPPE